MTPRFFDIHSHTNFAAFDGDRDLALKRAFEAGVFMNVVGTQKDTSKVAVELAEKYNGVYATVGLHPIHSGKSFHDKEELGPSFAEASEGKPTPGWTKSSVALTATPRAWPPLPSLVREPESLT